MPFLYETTASHPDSIPSTKCFSEQSDWPFDSPRKRSIISKSSLNLIPATTTQSRFGATTSPAPVTRRPVTDPFALSKADPPPSYCPPAITLAASANNPYAFLTTFDTIFLIDDSSSIAGRSWRETSVATASVCATHDQGAKDGNPISNSNSKNVQQSTTQPSLSSQGLQNKHTLKLIPPSCVISGPIRTVTPAFTSTFPASTSETRDPWAKQIVQRLSSIHEAGFVQGVFTLSNCLIDEDDEVRIVDISRGGCPAGWEPPKTVPLTESGPRLLLDIGVKSDLYQLGMLLWAIAMEEDEPGRQPNPTTVNHPKLDPLVKHTLSGCQTYLGWLLAILWIIPPAFAAGADAHPTPHPDPIWPFNEGPPGLGSFIFAIGIAILIIVYKISVRKRPESFANPVWGWYLLGSSTISCFCIMSDGTASLTTLVTIGLVQVYLGQSCAGMRHRTPDGRWYTMSVHLWPLIIILTVVFALLCMKTSPITYNQNTQLPWFPFTIPCFGLAVAVCVYLGYLGKSWERPVLPRYRDVGRRHDSF